MYMSVCAYIYIYKCLYVHIYVYGDIYIYVYMYTHICIYIYICIYMYICARVCICVCMYIYVYAYDICIYVGKYVHVCMWTLVDVIEGPYHPLRFTPCGLAAGGAVFIGVRSPNLTGTRRHSTDWLIFNFYIALTGDIIYLSQCLLLWCILHKWYSHAPQPCVPTVDN